MNTPHPNLTRGRLQKIGLIALCLSTLLAGCASTPNCAGEPDNPVDEAFAPLDNAVGDINQKINDEGPEGDCRLKTSSEIQKDS